MRKRGRYNHRHYDEPLNQEYPAKLGISGQKGANNYYGIEAGISLEVEGEAFNPLDNMAEEYGAYRNRLLANMGLPPLYDTFFNLLGTIVGLMVFLSVAWGIYGIGDTSTFGRSWAVCSR